MNVVELLESETPVVGVVVDLSGAFPNRPNPMNRVGILWADGDGMIDYEPKDWLEVISEAIPVEA